MSVEHPHREKAAQYSVILRERIEQKGILHELAGYPNFVVWRYHWVDGQRKKLPFDPNTHKPASPIDPRSWGTLETALTALAKGGYQGIGFMLSHSPFSGIDLDHSVKGGVLLPWAKAIVDAMDTYTEYSPSCISSTGEGGIHLLLEGKPPGSKKAGNVEIYREKHYLTITTNHNRKHNLLYGQIGVVPLTLRLALVFGSSLSRRLELPRVLPVLLLAANDHSPD